MSKPELDVLVVGAGVSGLAAALRLTRAGLKVAIAEARERTGGRVCTLHDPCFALPLEAGAEFIHGRPPEVWDVVCAAGLAVVELDGDEWQHHAGSLRRLVGLWDAVEPVMSRLDEAKAGDEPFAAFLQRRCGDLPPATVEAALAFVEGFHAAPASRASVRALAAEHRASQAIDESRSTRLIQGLDGVVKWLASSVAEKARIHLGAAVTELRWSQEAIEAETVSSAGAAGPSFRARRAILTLPVGVLRAPPGSTGAVRFDPDLPAKRQAAERLEMGAVIKVFLQFAGAFWESEQCAAVPAGASLGRLGFLVSRDEHFPTWWTAFPVRAPLLVGWSAGPAAASMEGLEPRAILARALGSISRLLGVPPARVESGLRQWHVQDWQRDPLSRGAYSYVPVGGHDARSELAAPVEDTLFFAGEATRSRGGSGTVAGAIASGLDAAGDVMRSLGAEEPAPVTTPSAAR